MRTRLPPNVTREKNRHGKVVFYYRVGKGPRIRLPDFGTPEFDGAYKAALAGEPIAIEKIGRGGIVREGTLAWLVIEYKKTLHFRGLDEITQKRRDSFFRQMVEKSGDKAIARITEKHIVDAVEKRTTGKGHAANNYLKAIKPIFAYAKKRKWIAVDPARNVDYVETINGTRMPWTMDDFLKYEKRHPLGTMANLALRILLFAGPRRSDAILLGRQHVGADGVVNFRPGKTADSSGAVATFTLLPPLKEAIEATEHLRPPARKGKPESLAFLRTEFGTPFASGASFGNWFRDRCVEAGLSVRAHGLRKLGPSLAAENEATPHELMSMWGWTTLAQAELYTKAANRQRMGAAASEKLMIGYTEATQTENNIPRTSEAGAGIGEKD